MPIDYSKFNAFVDGKNASAPDADEVLPPLISHCAQQSAIASSTSINYSIFDAAVFRDYEAVTSNSGAHDGGNNERSSDVTEGVFSFAQSHKEEIIRSPLFTPWFDRVRFNAKFENNEKVTSDTQNSPNSEQYLPESRIFGERHSVKAGEKWADDKAPTANSGAYDSSDEEASLDVEEAVLPFIPSNEQEGTHFDIPWFDSRFNAIIDGKEETALELKSLLTYTIQSPIKQTITSMTASVMNTQFNANSDLNDSNGDVEEDAVFRFSDEAPDLVAPRRGYAARHREVGLEWYTCQVRFCEQVFYGEQLPHCNHKMCAECIFKSIRATNALPTSPFSVECRICRCYYGVHPKFMQMLMMHFATTTHTKVLPCPCHNNDGKIYQLSHLPCDAGCYTCENSELYLQAIDIFGE